MRIRFLSDQVYDTGAPGKGPRFGAGDVLDESDVLRVLGMEIAPDGWAQGFLRRWLGRGVAEEVDGRTPATGPKGGEAPSKSDDQPAPVEVDKAAPAAPMTTRDVPTSREQAFAAKPGDTRRTR